MLESSVELGTGPVVTEYAGSCSPTPRERSSLILASCSCFGSRVSDRGLSSISRMRFADTQPTSLDEMNRDDSDPGQTRRTADTCGFTGWI
jgi:hypothetical protein